MGTPLGPKYIPYTHMDPLGMMADPRREIEICIEQSDEYGLGYRYQASKVYQMALCSAVFGLVIDFCHGV